MAENRQVIIDVEVEDKDFDKEIADVNKQLKENQKLIKELSKDYENNADQIARLEAENRGLSQSKRQLIKESQTEANSLNALRLRLASLTKERNNTNTATEEGAARFRELQQQIKATSDEIKSFEEEGGDFRRSVGEYVQQTNLFGVSLGSLSESVLTVTGVIGGLTAVAGGLFRAYTSSARGAEDLARANDRLDSVITQLGNSIADTFGSDGGGGILDTALASLQQRLLGLSSFVQSELSTNAQAALRELDILEVEQERIRKQQLQDAEIFRQIRDEERNSLEERRQANEDLIEVINRRESDSIAFQEKRLAQLRILLSLDQDNFDLRRAIQQVEFEIADIREDAEGFRSEALINDLALSRELLEDRTALTELQIQREIALTEEGTQERFELELQLIQKTQEIELEAAGQNAARRRIALQKALNAEEELRRQFAELRAAREEEASKAEQDRIERELRASQNLEIFRLEQEEKFVEAEQRRAEFLLQNTELTESERILIIERSEARIQKIRDDAARQDVEREKQTNTIKIQGERDFLGATALIADQGTALSKAVALTQIGIDTGRAIAALTAASEGNPANAVTFGGAGVAQFLAGIARIGANIAAAKAALDGGSSISAGGGGAFGGASPSLISSDPTLSNVNASLLSQFGQDARDSQDSNAAVIAAIAELPVPQVAVTDINTAQNRRQVKLNEAQLGD